MFFVLILKVLELNASEITKASGEVMRIVDGKVGDSSGCANFRLVGGKEP